MHNTEKLLTVSYFQGQKPTLARPFRCESSESERKKSVTVSAESERQIQNATRTTRTRQHATSDVHIHRYIERTQYKKIKTSQWCRGNEKKREGERNR